MDKRLEKYLPLVERPGRYVGGEYNLPDMEKPCSVRFCLCFADVYEVGMSNLGIAILYDVLNGAEGVVCERCFAPWKDLGKILKDDDIPLSSLETGRELREFDVVGFSVPYELSYTNVLYMLDLAKIPFRAEDRLGKNYPLIVGGGPVSANPEPIIDFFDVFFIGEGEETDLKFCRLVEKFKGDKNRILLEASKIDGVYVPSFCKTENGINVTPVKKAVVSDLNAAPYPVKPLVPNIEIVHDRVTAELFRGCYAGCRFCQACYFYRPVRYRERERILETVDALIANTGYDEVGISSLSTGDYEDIVELISELKERVGQKNVVLQIPSLRLDSFTAKLCEGAKKTSLTFAPEAGTQRLRDVINKNITDEDIENSMRIAFSSGYSAVKLYFMLGLPTESDEDVSEIASVVRKIRKIYSEVVGRKNLRLNVSAAMFVPKPATPFQYVAQIDGEEMKRRQNILKKEFSGMKGVKFAWHDAGASIIEGIFARGDRKLSRVVESAYAKGCFFDGWSEMFDFEKWSAALKENGADAEKYTGKRESDEVLPWGFIDFGVSENYLKKEYEKALKGETTPPCKYDCNGCGASRLAKCRLYRVRGKKESGN